MEVELKQVVRGSTERQATCTRSDKRFDGFFCTGRSCVVNVKRCARAVVEVKRWERRIVVGVVRSDVDGALNCSMCLSWAANSHSERTTPQKNFGKR